ncbi:MAG: PA0069 family radical SAM protein [Planctomycetota bacterium]|nr:PA0069 family radical SAM protein [Planctomycetota bacterium]
MPPRLLSNPPNPWSSTHVEWLEEPPVARLEVYEEEAESVLSTNDSPDVGFRWSVNPYRGCWHACAYCFARPGHQLLGFGAGTDFERRIVVKTNAPEVLSVELARRSWRRETVVFSGVTDCYQPLEASYALTRRCLEICLARRTPVAIITKSTLIRRDVDLLARLASGPGAHVTFSIPFLDEPVARALEPGAPTPSRRFETMRLLADAGVPVGISLAPLIPGFRESDIPALLVRAKENGASSAFTTLLRLPAEVAPVFEERFRAAFPDHWNKVEGALREMRGGGLKDARFGHRMHGRGPRWDALMRLFEIQRRRVGLADTESKIDRPPDAGSAAQLELFP